MRAVAVLVSLSLLGLAQASEPPRSAPGTQSPQGQFWQPPQQPTDPNPWRTSPKGSREADQFGLCPYGYYSTFDASPNPASRYYSTPCLPAGAPSPTGDRSSVFAHQAPKNLAPLAELRVRPGRRTVTLQRDGHEPTTFVVDVAPGGRYRLSHRLAPTDAEPIAGRIVVEQAGGGSAADGLLRIRVVPDDAEIVLDGTFVGTGRRIASEHRPTVVAKAP